MMPEGAFRCDMCGREISNPPKDPKYCPHAYRCGLLNLCGLMSTTCEATKTYTGRCTHYSLYPPPGDPFACRPGFLGPPTPEKGWLVHKRVKKQWVPWNLERNQPEENQHAKHASKNTGIMSEG
jgi:hypothetical protein